MSSHDLTNPPIVERVTAACAECGREFETIGAKAYACPVCEKPMCVYCEASIPNGYAHKMCVASSESKLNA